MGDNWMLRYHFKIKRRGPTLPSEFSSGFVGEVCWLISVDPKSKSKGLIFN